MANYRHLDPRAEALGEAAAKVRKLKYDKQTTLAKAISEAGYAIHYNTVSYYESGVSKMPVAYLVALCKSIYGDKWLAGAVWILRKAYDE